MIANDYLVNSGGVIFAAQEHLVPTPAHLQIPADIISNRVAVKSWLVDNEAEFSQLSAKRLAAGIAHRDRSIRRNMTELVDLLASSTELLPGQAAERTSLQRLTAKESERTAKDIMDPMPTIEMRSKIQEAAELIVKTQSNIIAVLTDDGKLAGVITTWDITRAVADGTCEQSVETIMTREAISVAPGCGILDMVTELEQNQFSAMPVVDDRRVLEMV